MTERPDFHRTIDGVARLMTAAGPAPDVRSRVLDQLHDRHPSRWRLTLVPAAVTLVVGLVIIARGTHRLPAHAVLDSNSAPAVSSPARPQDPDVVDRNAAVGAVKASFVRNGVRPTEAQMTVVEASESRIPALPAPEPLSISRIQPEPLTIRPLDTTPLVIAPLDEDTNE